MSLGMMLFTSIYFLIGLYAAGIFLEENQTNKAFAVLFLWPLILLIKLIPAIYNGFLEFLK